MSDEQTSSNGPDFSIGISVSEVASGAILLGQVQGEPAILARVENEFFAIGAVCTHYSGPLAEGLLVGDTVRCPWHHACFSLRTGEALRAPALNPVSRWRVERQGDMLYVREKLATPSLTRRSAVRDVPRDVLIVGGGAAGNAAAETLRNEGYAGRITMLSADDAAPYDRPNLSKDYLAGKAREGWMPLQSPDFYRDRKIDLKLNTRVTSIDVKTRQVKTEDGSLFGYGALLLATGGEPIHLAIPGSDRPHVHYLRSLADSRKLIAKAATARRAVVVGASFIGLEVAASLRARNLEVHVVAPETCPMERVLGPELGAFIRSLHEKEGVVFHLGTTAVSIDERRVTLKNGESVEADLVVVGIGVRPLTLLAEGAALACERGVLVDTYLQTSAPGVFAVGDIARWPDAATGERLRVEHWVVAERQGQTAARNILGQRERFEAVPFFWSQHYDVAISYVGHAEQWDDIEIDGVPAKRDCTATFRRGDRKLAVATIFRDRESLRAELAFEQLEAR